MSFDPQTSQLFSRQLAHWAETALRQGRYPFRKVETAPTLLTDQGRQQPALVLWINRDSYMAGGVILCPERSAEQSVAAGAACARALGLRHFVAWAPREIVIWELREEAVARKQTILLPDPGEGGRHFRSALGKTMEELKVLSVLGAVPPAQLSPYYLANLCLGTLDTATPILEKSYRIARSEEQAVHGQQSPVTLASQKGAMALLRLLCLTCHDALPATVQPEGLERAMEFALDTLPPALRPPFRQQQGERPMPEECSVHFHHLFRRLTQLRWWDDSDRTTRTLELLLAEQGTRWGGYPLPSPPSAPEGPLLLVNTGELLAGETPSGEIAPAPLLALTSLLRNLQRRPMPAETANEVLSFSASAAPRLLLGTLTDERIPTARERKTMAARLRLGWPTRRFPLPPSTPRWVWELLHLLGIIAAEGEIVLRLPAFRPAAPFWFPLADLIREQFTLTELQADATETILGLTKQSSGDGLVTVIGAAGRRQISWRQVQKEHWTWLALALELPEPLFALLIEGSLQVATETTWPAHREREVFLYARSSLGRRLWNLVSGGQPLPRREQMGESFRRYGVPLPAPETLENLRLLPWQEGTPPPVQRVLDRELAAWFDRDLPLSDLPSPQRSSASPTQQARESRRDNSTLSEEISRAVFVDGLPRFPEQYLYDHFRPELREYTFAGPLTCGEEFFGHVVLRDQKQTLLEVEGRETALALLLASYSGRTPVALPADRLLTAEILGRYRRDLGRLRQSLLRQAHARVADPRRAAALAERIWNGHPLPPWNLIDE